MKFKNIAIIILSATIGAGAITYFVNKKEYKPSLGNELYNEAKLTQEKYRKLKEERNTLDDLNSQPEEEISFLEQKLDSENLLTHDNAVQLDIDNDGIKEIISLKYEADSEYLEIRKAHNKYICNEKPCTTIMFELIKKKGDYIFKIGESVSSSPGEICISFDEDSDGNMYVEDKLMSKYRYQDEFIWREDKLIPIHKWTIQIASFLYRRNAVNYIEKYLNKGYDVYVQSVLIDDEKWNKVFIGSYKTEDEAQIALNRFKKEYPNSEAFIKSKELVTCERLN